MIDDYANVEGESDEPVLQVSRTSTENESLSVTVVLALMSLRSANGRSPRLTTPLWEVVDPDAVDALFDGTETGLLSFEYEDYEVVATADGEVLARRR